MEGENVSVWIEILKFVGPPAAVAIIFFWQYCRFANRMLDRVDKREDLIVKLASDTAGISATTTEVCRGLCEKVDANTQECRAIKDLVEKALDEKNDTGAGEPHVGEPD